MNPYLEPAGFLGTGASLLADLTLVVYLLLIIPGMVIGTIFALRGMHRPAHKWTMIIITAVNWLLIIFLMLAAYRFDIASNITQEPGNARYLMPTIHGLLGIPAQLLATYIVYRMLREDTLVARARMRGESGVALQRYWFRSAKPIMRITLLLWLATSVLGVLSYAIRYELLPSSSSASSIPVVTAEPVATLEVATTPEPAVTIEPAFTPEVDDHDDDDDDDNDDNDDNSGRGSRDDDDDDHDDNSGRGSGDDDHDNSGRGSSDDDD